MGDKRGDGLYAFTFQFSFTSAIETAAIGALEHDSRSRKSVGRVGIASSTLDTEPTFGTSETRQGLSEVFLEQTV